MKKYLVAMAVAVALIGIGKTAVSAIDSDPEVVAQIEAKNEAEQAVVAHDPQPVTLTEGISKAGDAPTSGMNFLPENKWTGRSADGYVVVYAGLDGMHDSTAGGVSKDGAVFVTTIGEFGGVTDAEQVVFEGSGRLEIVSAEGATLTLQNKKGETFTYLAPIK